MITKGPVPGDRPLGLPRINPRGDEPDHEGALRPAGLAAKEFSAPGQRSWYLTVPLVGRGATAAVAARFSSAGC
jgi:hypothetical protein